MQIFVKDKKFYSTFFALMLPIALQNLIAFGAGLADSLMLGRYSESALTAVALVNQLQFFFQMVLGGVGEGIVVICAQYWGKKATDRIKDVVGVGMRIGVVLSMVMALATILFAEQYMHILSKDPAVIAEGITYMRVVGFAYFFFGPVNLLLCTLRSVETVKIGFIISLVALVTDVFFNYLLIYGKLGFPEMGTAGAAITTVMGQVIELIMLVIYVFYIDQKLRLRIKDFLRFRWDEFRQFIRMAAPVMASNGSWGIAMWIQTFILSSLGGTAVAASSIAGTAFSILMVLVYGSANAANILIGKTVGEGKTDQIPLYARTLQIIFLAIGLFTGAVIFLSRDLFLGFYSGTISPESLALARQFMTVLSVTSIGTAYQMSCLTGIVRGGGDTKFVFFNDMIFMWGIVLPLAILATFVFHLSPLIVFIILKSDQILKCGVAVVKVNRFRWIRKVA